MARVGILGGTFNPPHLGHVACAVEARAQLGLERVLLMPVAAPPHKRAVGDPGAKERLELCARAVAAEPGVEVSRLEVDRGGPSYTAVTLRELHERAPEDDLTFIVGGDMALDIPAWREPDAVVALATLGVAERSGAAREDIAERLRGTFGDRARVAFFDLPRLDISSTAVRRRVVEGRPYRYLVGGAVADRIAERGLYRE